MSMSRVVIVGNVGKDAEALELGGKPALRFTVAVNQWAKEEKDRTTDWFSVVTFRPNDFLKEVLVKGAHVTVAGTFKSRGYQDKSGVSRTSLDVIADDVQVAGTKKGEAHTPPSKAQPASDLDNTPF